MLWIENAINHNKIIFLFVPKKKNHISPMDLLKSPRIRGALRENRMNKKDVTSG